MTAHSKRFELKVVFPGLGHPGQFLCVRTEYGPFLDAGGGDFVGAQRQRTHVQIADRQGAPATAAVAPWPFALTDAELSESDAAFMPRAGAGDRYRPEMMRRSA